MNLNDRVIVQSELAPIYNGLRGRILSSVTDPITGVSQYKVEVSPTDENRAILTSVGEPYVHLDKLWHFWFIESELQSA